MNNSKNAHSNSWRHVFLLILVLGSLAIVLMQSPIKQDLSYHEFIDARFMFGIPNFYNVISNFPFLLVGIYGAAFCHRKLIGPSKTAWLIFFIGIGLVAMGSTYYHLEPNNQRLLWDRLPMTIGFMGMFAALLGELVRPALTRYLLFPLILVGICSVLLWHWHDDLRLYVWVQFMPLLVIPAMLILYRKRYSHIYLLVFALLFYLAAKLLEMFDTQVFSFFQNEMAGHAIKHVFAAMGAAVILWMLQIRKSLE